MITTTEESNARKEKGETLQMDVAAKLRAAFPQYAEDIESTPMSAHGEDIKILSAEARGAIPVSIEAKWKTSGLSNVYDAYQQAARQAEALPSVEQITPVAVIQQKGYDPLDCDGLRRLDRPNERASREQRQYKWGCDLMDCVLLIRAADQMFEQNDLAFNEKTEKALSFLRSVGVIPIRRASVNSHHHVRFSGMLVAALEQDTTVDLRSRKQSTLHDLGVTTVLIRWLDNAVEQGILVPANGGSYCEGCAAHR